MDRADWFSFNHDWPHWLDWTVWRHRPNWCSFCCHRSDWLDGTHGFSFCHNWADWVDWPKWAHRSSLDSDWLDWTFR